MIRSTARIAVLSLCMLALAAPVSAKGKGNRPARVKPPKSAHAFHLPKSISLTPEQQAKLDEIRKNYEPKIEEALKKEGAILTEEQKAAKLQAESEAKQKITQIKAEVAEKAKITPEQAQQLKDSKKEVSKLSKEAKEQVMALLTEEQKAVMHTKTPKAKRVKKNS